MKCKLCQKNVGFVSGNKTEASKKYGVDRASVRRHNAHASKTQPEPLVVTGSEKEISFENLITEDTHPDTAFHQIFALANLDPEEYELKDGSLRFSTWEAQGKGGETKQLYSYRGTFIPIESYAKKLEADIVKDIKSFTVTSVKESIPCPTYFLSISDLQVGKCDSGYGTNDTSNRVQKSVINFIKSLPAKVVPQIVLIDGGDIIENMFNTAEQPYTNDLDLSAQVRVARRLVIKIITELALHTENLVYISVPSNHGQVRSSIKNQAGNTEADFGLDIQEQVKDAVGMNADLSNRITFIRPDYLEETAVFITQDGTKIAVNHGHRTGGPAKVGTWWAKQDHGRMPGYDADILVVAHFHTPYIQQSGNGRWVLGMSSAEPGSQYFALKNGERSLKGCTMFTTNQGQWSNYEIV